MATGFELNNKLQITVVVIVVTYRWRIKPGTT